MIALVIMQVGLIGLGNMGINLLQNLSEHGHHVVAWNRSATKREQARELAIANVTVVDELTKVVNQLPSPRIILCVISAGSAVDDLFFTPSGLHDLLTAGDVIIELANSHYQDSRRRATKLASKNIYLLDAGISGGVNGARNGACIMIGGDQSAYTKVEPLLKDICQPEGYGHFGTSGAGHFIKMAHNGIEYGMMQAIAEGLSLVADFQADSSSENSQAELKKLLRVWNHGSIIQSNLLGYLERALAEQNLATETDNVGDLGTGRWSSEEALKRGVPLTNITHAVYSRFLSREKNWIGWKAISAMRRVFGVHSDSDRPID